MYFPDLTEEKKERFNFSLIKVAWLEKGMPYTKGDVSKEFLEKLKNIGLKIRTKGWHDCPFCGNAKSSNQYRIEKQGKSQKYYDVPQMIIHYIEEHNYCPPQEFIDAVMAYVIEPKDTSFQHCDNPRWQNRNRNYK